MSTNDLPLNFSTTEHDAPVTTGAQGGAEYTESELFMLEIDRAVKVYYSLVLVSVGTVFNILSILVLNRTAFRHSTTSVYLRFLACVDMFVLYNGLSRHFVSGISNYNIRYLSNSFCKFNQWSSSFAPDISAWILVAVTTERVMSIIWPHKVRVMCSRVKAGVVVTVISVVIMAANLHLMFFYGNKETFDPAANRTAESLCVLLEPGYESFMSDVWYWLDLLKFVLLPSSILIIFNILIVIFVIRSRRRVEKIMTRAPALGRSPASALSAGRAEVRTTEPTQPSTSSVYNRRVNGPNKEVSLTLTLLAINATFVICNTPIMVYLLGSERWFPPGFLPAERLTLTTAVMAMYTNNAANFLLYCATGSRFRAETRHMFLSLRHRSLASGSRAMRDSTGSDNGKNFRLEEQLATALGSRDTFCTEHSKVYY